MRTYFPTYAYRIYVTASRVRFGLEDFGLLTLRRRLLCASCSLRQCFASGFLQIPPHDGHPCRAASGSSYMARSGLAPYSRCALPGAPKKEAALAASFLEGSDDSAYFLRLVLT